MQGARHTQGPRVLVQQQPWAPACDGTLGFLSMCGTHGFGHSQRTVLLRIMPFSCARGGPWLPVLPWRFHSQCSPIAQNPSDRPHILLQHRVRVGQTSFGRSPSGIAALGSGLRRLDVSTDGRGERVNVSSILHCTSGECENMASQTRRKCAKHSRVLPTSLVDTRPHASLFAGREAGKESGIQEMV